MKIAIIGAGFSGLAACYYLSLRQGVEITVFDGKGLGGGASGVAAGLLHPYAGPESKLNWRAGEGIRASTELLEAASEHLGRPVFQKSGILRLALSDRQKEAYRRAADAYADVDRVEEVDVPGVAKTEGIFISSGINVNCLDYLEGLWKACESRKCRLVRKHAQDLEEFKDFDVVILAAGAAANHFLPIKLYFIKGQLLKFEWPENLPPLKCPIVSKKYIVMDPGGRSCWVGSTYEKNFIDHDVDVQSALADIMPEARRMIPGLAKSRVIDCQAAIRAFTPQRRPVALQVDQKHWAVAGMGSKGLLYHALMAKELDSSLNSS